jgi:aspartate racemase
MASKRIGIVGGIGPSATVLYYQGLIGRYYERMKDQHFPEIVIHSLDFEEINQYFENDLGLLADKVAGAVRGLQACGCDFALFACNAMHMVYEDVNRHTSLPLLNIIECVLDEVRKKRVRKVGLMGTTFIVQNGIYQRLLGKSGIECVLVDNEEQIWIMNAICQDLQRPPVPASTLARFSRNVDDMDKRGAEGLILACTDLPLAVTQENSSIPLFDSMKIHVEAALDVALGLRPLSKGVP